MKIFSLEKNNNNYRDYVFLIIIYLFFIKMNSIKRE